MNPGDIAWVLVVTGLLVMMVPALGLSYGEPVRKKNMISTIIQS